VGRGWQNDEKKKEHRGLLRGWIQSNGKNSVRRTEGYLGKRTRKLAASAIITIQKKNDPRCIESRREIEGKIGGAHAGFLDPRYKAEAIATRIPLR